MSRNTRNALTNSATREVMNHRVDAIAPALDLEEPFSVEDVRDVCGEDIRLGFWQTSMAWRVVGTEYISPESHERNLYEWNPRIRKYLKQRRENGNRLPCGCRFHINHSDDGFECKFCGEDYTREEIKKAAP